MQHWSLPRRRPPPPSPQSADASHPIAVANNRSLLPPGGPTPPFGAPTTARRPAAAAQAPALLALVLLLSALLPLCTAAGELLLVYSVQRHGARNVLPKTALLQESDAHGGPTLLPQGQRQAYEAGLAYQRRYLNASTCAPLCLASNLSVVGPEYGVVNTNDGQWNK